MNRRYHKQAGCYDTAASQLTFPYLSALTCSSVMLVWFAQNVQDHFPHPSTVLPQPVHQKVVKSNILFLRALTT